MLDGLPLVSIITPSFNASAHIEETIHSVSSQDYPRIEHIVIDGSSIDGTVDILRNHINLRWISEPDHGQSDALNKGIELACGDIVCWLNADDSFATETSVTSAVGAFLSSSYPDVIYGSCNIIDEAGNQVDYWPASCFALEKQLLGNIVAPAGVFMRRDTVRRLGGIRLDLHYAMDYDLWIRMARSDATIAGIPEVLANFRMCQGTKSIEHPERFWPEVIDAIIELYQSGDLPSSVANMEQLALGHAWWRAGLAYYAAGQRINAQEACAIATRQLAIFETDEQFAIEALIHQAYGRSVADASKFINDVTASLNEIGILPEAVQRRILAHHSVVLAFRYHQAHDHAGVRSSLRRAFADDITWLKNPGVVSIGLESMLGANAALALRKLYAFAEGLLGS